MISLASFLATIDQNVARIIKYHSGGDGTRGLCDCIGLIIGAIRLAGAKWSWAHGSNYAARNRIRSLRRVSSASELSLGELVFKAHEPGEEGYDAATINSTYKNSPDKRDYYHVGVVTSVSPLCITHCTGVEGGIMRDTSLGKWRFAGELNLVDYEGDVPMDEVLYKAVVHADNGYPVKMRSQPNSQSTILAKIPLGVPVDVLDELNGWAKIGVDGKTGYMMLKYLTKEEAVSGIDVGNSFDRQTLEELKATLVPFLQAIEKALNGGAVG